MPNVSRRKFLKGSSVAVATPLMAASGQVLAKESASTGTTLDYPETAIGNANELPVNEAITFNYPDASSPCAMIRMGHTVPGGIGPDKDIVAYSTMCNHMGCSTLYDAETRTFKCPCHFSVFDSEKTGQLVSGQATENLPQITLSYNADSDVVSAVGIDGLIFGRQANIL